MFSPVEFFLLIRIYMGSRNKFSLVAQAATLWPRIDIEVFFILERLVPSSSVIASLAR